MSQKSKGSKQLLSSIRRHISSGSLHEKACTHRDSIQDVAASAPGCEGCLAMGDTWVHLRMCMTCGHVGCCNDSKNKHASKHFQSSDHPIMKSLEPGEDWMWCFIDQTKVSTL